MDALKQARNCFCTLSKNENSLLYGENGLTKNLVEKARKLNYEKGKTAAKFLSYSESKEKITEKSVYSIDSKIS